MKTTPLCLLVLAASFLVGGCTVLEVADREDMRRGAGSPTAIVYVNEAGPLSTQEMRDRRGRVEDYLVNNGYLTGREVIVGRTSQADRVIRVVLEADGGFSFSVYLPEEIDTRVAYASGYYGVRSYFPDHYYSSAYFYDPYWHAGYYFDSTPVLYFSPSVWWSNSYRPNYRQYNPGYPGGDRGGYGDNHRGGGRGTSRPSTYHGTPSNTVSQPPNWAPGSTPQHGTDNPNLATSGRPRGTKPSSGGLWANRAREDAPGDTAGTTAGQNQQVRTDTATTTASSTSRPAYSNSNRTHSPRPYTSEAANSSSGGQAYGHRAAPNYSGGSGGSSSYNPPQRHESNPSPRQDHGSAPRRDYTPAHSSPSPSYSSGNNSGSGSSASSSSRSSDSGSSRSSSPPPHKEFVPKQPEN